ncbi:MAG: hypothetical protein AAGB24_10125 [Bacteroidota bacterium]
MEPSHDGIGYSLGRKMFGLLLGVKSRMLEDEQGILFGVSAVGVCPFDERCEPFFRVLESALALVGMDVGIKAGLAHINTDGLFDFHNFSLL